MMHVRENADLSRENTLGFSAKAKVLVVVDDVKSLREALRSVSARNLPVMILGGGSNVVLSGDFDGLVIKPDIKGVCVVEDNGSEVVLEAGSGVVWHDLVMQTVGMGLYGLENLALIPGTVGAAPVQNIGAYGVELKDVMERLSAIHRVTGEERVFTRDDCRFSYRESVFKNDEQDRWVITSVRFRLSRIRLLKLDYGDIRKQLEGIRFPVALDVAKAVIAIRQSKLPDPCVIGNAGSFFKNPVVSQPEHVRLLGEFPSIVAYPQADGVKLAAGWLIEQCGFRGQRRGAVGCYEKQALVLVHFGQGTGRELLELAADIQRAVLEKFGVTIEMEPRVY